MSEITKKLILRMCHQVADVIERNLPPEYKKYLLGGVDRSGGYSGYFTLSEALETAINDTGDEEHFCDCIIITNAAQQQICIVYNGNVFVPVVAPSEDKNQ